MFSNAARFYGACLKRAFGGWFKRVEGWASTVSLLIAIVLLFLRPSARLGDLAQAAPAWFFLLAFATVVGVRLFMSPYLVYRDERSAREDLEHRRRPTLEFSLPSPPIIQSIDLRGSTTETLGGTRQTIVTDCEMDVVALECVNVGEIAVRGCRARLLSVSRTGDDGSLLRATSPIDLPWSKEDPEGSLVVDLAPAEVRRIWIGGVRSHGHVWLFRRPESLPIEYQRLLGAAGTYRIVLQVDGDGLAPQQIELEIVAGEGQKPVIGIWRGAAGVAIVARGAPRLEG